MDVSMNGNWQDDSPLNMSGQVLWHYTIQFHDMQDMKVKTCSFPICMRDTIQNYVVFTGVRSRTMKYGNGHNDEGISDVRGTLRIAILYEISDASVDSLIERRTCMVEKKGKNKNIYT